MYLRFYDLKRNIFQFNTNPEFTWIGDKLERTLSQMEGSLVSRPGLYQLIGDVGVGKSTLATILAKRLTESTIIAEVSDSSLSLMDLLNYLSISCEIGKRYKSKEEFQPDFEKFLAKAGVNGQQVLIVIDESQALGKKMPCHLQWLAGLDSETNPVLSILLVGQKDLRNIDTEEESGLSSQILETYTVDALDLSETTEYVQQSLKFAGAEREIFTLDALQAVYQLSHGVLRNINILCDNAMIGGHFRKEQEITRNRVKESGVDFDLSSDSVMEQEIRQAGDRKKPSRPIVRSFGRVLATALALTLIGGGVYYYNSIELIPEMEQGGGDIQVKVSDAPIKTGENAVKGDPLGTPDNVADIEDTEVAVAAPEETEGSIALLVPGKVKKIVPLGKEQRTAPGISVVVPVMSSESHGSESDNTEVKEAVLEPESGAPSEPGRLVTTIPAPGGDVAEKLDGVTEEVSGSGAAEASAGQVEKNINKAQLRDAELKTVPETVTERSRKEDTSTGKEQHTLVHKSARAGPEKASLLKPTPGIGPGIVSLKKIPTPEHSETMVAPPATQVTRTPPLGKESDDGLVYRTLSKEQILGNDLAVAHHPSPASPFQDDSMVQPYTPPEDENAKEEIDPGDVIDWLIKSRNKNRAGKAGSSPR